MCHKVCRGTMNGDDVKVRRVDLYVCDLCVYCMKIFVEEIDGNRGQDSR